jgi:hypothetical protein
MARAASDAGDPSIAPILKKSDSVICKNHPVAVPMGIVASVDGTVARNFHAKRQKSLVVLVIMVYETKAR